MIAAHTPMSWSSPTPGQESKKPALEESLNCGFYYPYATNSPRWYTVRIQNQVGRKQASDFDFFCLEKSVATCISTATHLACSIFIPNHQQMY